MKPHQLGAMLAAVLAFPTVSVADPLPFTVSRDGWGVPHVSAATTEDLFRGQGYASAQDRLWQGELYSRSGMGTLCEILGGFYLAADQFARGEGYTEAELDSQYAALRPETRSIIEAYADGVNLRIAEVMADPEMLLPYEFWELGCVPSAWTPRRTMAVVKDLGRQFGAAGGQELERLDDLFAMGPSLFNQTYPINDPTAPATITSIQGGGSPGSDGAGAFTEESLRRYLETTGATVRPEGRRILEERGRRLALLRRQLGLPPKFGSYMTAVAPARSATGRSMLLGCPQSGYPSPLEAQFAAEVDLQGAGWSVSGMSTAGMPGVWIGRNQALAWSLTSGISDNIDIYLESLNPGDPRQYWFQGAWRDIQFRTETIWIHDTPVPYYARRTVHGPVFGVSDDGRQAYARKLAFWAREMDFLEMLLDLNRATSLDGVEAAAARSPLSFNVMAAASSGEIGYWHAGIFQDRMDGIDPRLPHIGNGGQEWHGLRDAASLPHARNPAVGYFANWNNKPHASWNNGDNVPWVGFQHVQYMFDYLNPQSTLTFQELKLLPPYVFSPGSYVQLIQFGSPVLAQNVLPPGQSGFVSRFGVYDPHFRDQYDLWYAWGLKTWEFHQEAASVGGQPAGGTPPAAVMGGALVSGLRAAPQPFGSETTVSFTLGRASAVAARIYTVGGRLVRTLEDGAALGAGVQELRWDGRDERGMQQPAGVYLVRVEAGGEPAAVAKIIRAR